MDNLTAIESILLSLGITSRYKGYDHAVYCISLAMSDEYKSPKPKRNIYTAAAERFGCRWNCIERNIKTLTIRAWRSNPELICLMAEKTLTGAPTVSEFIDMAANHIIKADK